MNKIAGRAWRRDPRAPLKRGNSLMDQPKRRRTGSEAIRAQDTVRLSAAGAGMLLGDLEQRVIGAAWKLGRPSTARELHDVVARRHHVAYISSVTVANRLVEKGLLRREKVAQVFRYSPTLSREDFLLQASRHVVRRILGLGTRAVTSSFVDALAEHEPEELAELARLVRQKLRYPAK